MSVKPPPDEIARSHHFVPQWYQCRFLPGGKGEFFVFDKDPLRAVRCPDGKVRPIAKPREVFPCGSHALFQRENLYAVQFPRVRPDAIERLFFGGVDDIGAKANSMFSQWPESNGHFFKPNMEIPKEFGHPSERMGEFVGFMDAQKSRTPKGIDQIKSTLAKAGYLNPDNNVLMAFLLQRRAFNSTVWAECQWEIFSARNSAVKFLLSDDPVTLYNRDCYPASASCVYPHDPDPFWKGTRVLHALSPESLLVLTHSEHMDNPSRLKAKQNRRNARSYDEVILNYMSIVNDREFTAQQVANINHIIRSRAARYVASVNRDDLFPEKQCIRNDAYDIDALRQRIARAADPIGALIDVANGKPLRFMDEDEAGNTVERLEHVSVSQRITVLRELKDALIPKISRNSPELAEQRQNKDWDDLVTRRARL